MNKLTPSILALVVATSLGANSQVLAAPAGAATERFMRCEMTPKDRPGVVPATYQVYGGTASMIKLANDGGYATADYVIDKPIQAVRQTMGVSEPILTAGKDVTVEAWRKDHGVSLKALAGGKTHVFCGTDQGQY